MRTKGRLYEATSNDILDVLRRTPSDVGCLLVVGHNPGLQTLALALTGRADREDREKLEAKYPTGAIAIIDFDGGEWSAISENAGRLEQFVTPKSLEADMP